MTHFWINGISRLSLSMPVKSGIVDDEALYFLTTTQLAGVPMDLQILAILSDVFFADRTTINRKKIAQGGGVIFSIN